MEKITLVCDCGCKATATSVGEGASRENWFVLSQPLQNVKNDDPKLDRVFHFASLQCLEKWSAKAVPIVVKLQEGTHHERRGSYINDNLPGVRV